MRDRLKRIRRAVLKGRAHLARERQLERAYYLQLSGCQVADLWLLYSRFLGEHADGLFVEVGANDGVYASNTWGLAARGWRGIMIEPVPGVADRCRANHRDHPAITVVQTAIGAPGVASVNLRLGGHLSTGNPALAQRLAVLPWSADRMTTEQVVVGCRTLDDVLEEHCPGEQVDVVVIDVEGCEAEVFAGFDLRRWRPLMLIVELVDAHSDLGLLAWADAQLGEAIWDAGYRVVAKDAINTVFVRRDVWAEALQRLGVDA